MNNGLFQHATEAACGLCMAGRAVGESSRVLFTMHGLLKCPFNFISWKFWCDFFFFLMWLFIRLLSPSRYIESPWASARFHHLERAGPLFSTDTIYPQLLLNRWLRYRVPTGLQWPGGGSGSIPSYVLREAVPMASKAHFLFLGIKVGYIFFSLPLHEFGPCDWVLANERCAEMMSTRLFTLMCTAIAWGSC